MVRTERLRYATLMASGAVVLAWQAIDTRHWLPTLLLAWCALALLWLSVTYACRRAGLLGKQTEDGTMRWTYGLPWLPYALLQHLAWRLARRSALPATRIAPVLWLGPVPVATDRSWLHTSGIVAILDLTAEFAATAALLRGRRYLCLPQLDADAPIRTEIDAALAWIESQDGPVYLHCAQGHGRSATIALAWLLRRRLASHPTAALERLREQRPRARPNAGQWRALTAWWTTEPK